MNVAKAIDAIPVVQSTTERTTLFAIPTIDQRVFNKQTRSFERYDGTKWITDFDGTVVLSVKTFGAKGDGASNDTAAFAACVTAIAALGGGTMFIPAGSYIADPPALVANLSVQGAGKGRTTITAATINGSWIGTDVSNIEVTDLTFVGLANNGATTTDHALFFHASTVDITNVAVRRCHFRQFKSTDSCVRIAGNGDLVTPATHFVNRTMIEDCTVEQYYDTDPTLVGVAAHGIYLFGGIKGAWVQRCYVDGTSGKIGIIAQSEANDVHIEDNIVVNCGQANAATPFGYGITVYSSYTTVSVVDAFICRNTVVNTTRAGVYLAAIGKYVVNDNIFDTCDTNSLGLGNIASGAIQVNNNVDQASNGMGTVTGNTIINPGLIGLYINGGSFGRSNCTVTSNSLRQTDLTVARTGIVYNGRGCVIGLNEIRGFSTGIFLYNTADNIVGDCTIANNEIDQTGVTNAGRSGIIANSFTFIINAMVITGNRFKNSVSGVDIRTVTDIVFTGNTFSGMPGTALNASIQGFVSATISGNVTDGGATGLLVILKAATATARALIFGNRMGLCTNPLTLTENTGQANISGNDFGTQPGRAADQGDANIASATNNPSFEVFPFSTTLTANRSVTLNAAKCVKGDKKTIVRDAAVPGAFTLALINDLGATLATIPAGTKGFATAIFNGTNWLIHSSGTYA